MSEINEQIIAIENEMAKAYNEGHIEQILEHFSPGLIGFSSTTYNRIQGLDSLQKTFEYYWQKHSNVHFRVFDFMIQETASVVVATFYWVVTVGQGNNRHEIPGRGTHAFQNIDGRWKIIHEHFSKT